MTGEDMLDKLSDKFADMSDKFFSERNKDELMQDSEDKSIPLKYPIIDQLCSYLEESCT